MSTRRVRRCARSPQLLPPTDYRLPTLLLPRRGISLLEVLISMFVLLFGLMGVASIFPVGNHHAGKGDQYDRGAAMTESAFAELHARGMLRPQTWMYANENPVMNQSGAAIGSFFNTSGDGPGHAFVIDPMGAAGANDNFFPMNANGGMNPWAGTAPLDLTGSQWPIRRLSLPVPNPANSANVIKMPVPVAETIFRLRDDLANELPEEGDRPGIQRWASTDFDPATGNANNTPKDPRDDTLLQRSYAGSYSWLATITPTTPDGAANLQPYLGMAGSAQYEVAVAVFFKRARTPSIETERLLNARFYAGGEVEMSWTDPLVMEQAFDEVRSGQWIALTGVNPNNGQLVLTWYRLLSLDDETSQNGSEYVRRAMVDGPDWPMAFNASQANDLRAIILPGIINVSTQVVTMERE